MCMVHHTEDSLPLLHNLIEFTKLAESQILVVLQAPLTFAVVVTEVVSFSWEINPLWMCIFITHEVEVCFTTETESYQPNHLMQRHSSTYDEVIIVFTKVIYFLIKEHID